MIICKIQDKTRNIFNIEIYSARFVNFVNRHEYYVYDRRTIMLLDTKFLQVHEMEAEYLLRLYR